MFKGKKNVQIRLADVSEVDRANNKVITNIGEFYYDYLVIAVGCKTNFFGNSQLEENTFTLKTTYDAITVRNHILQTFETIISASNEEKESLLNLVIVGAGPTGVELAGAFAEIKKDVLPNDYPGINFSEFNVHLVEGSPNTLNNMSEKAKKASKKYLQKMGVLVQTETFVKDYNGDTLTLSTGATIKSKTVIWAAGVIGNQIGGFAEEMMERGHKFKVNITNKVKQCDNIFALGDIAYMETPKYPNGHPQVANVAINQAKLLAKNLKRKFQKRPLENFE